MSDAAQRDAADQLGGNLGYLLAFAIPLILIASIWLGRLTGYEELFVFLPLLAAYGAIPVVQYFRPLVSQPLSPEILAAPGWRSYYRILPRLSPPLQLAMLIVATDAFCNDALGFWGAAVLLLTTGIFGTLFDINIAHILIHRRGGIDRVIGGLLLSMVCFGSFRNVHLQVHHPFVGTSQDFATAARGETIYRFWRRSWVGNIGGAIRCERERLAKTGSSFWFGELFGWSLVSLAWLLGAIAFWGWQGGVFFLLQSTIAIMKLDVVNYIQHYGLTRRGDPIGGFEPVQIRHAWSQNLQLDDFLLLNLPRHGDHHAHPHVDFERLETPEDAPRYPYCYATMSVLVLIPSWFRRVAHPCLDRAIPSQVAVSL